MCFSRTKRACGLWGDPDLTDGASSAERQFPDLGNLSWGPSALSSAWVPGPRVRPGPGHALLEPAFGHHVCSQTPAWLLN